AWRCGLLRSSGPAARLRRGCSRGAGPTGGSRAAGAARATWGRGVGGVRRRLGRGPSLGGGKEFWAGVGVPLPPASLCFLGWVLSWAVAVHEQGGYSQRAQHVGHRGREVLAVARLVREKKIFQRIHARPRRSRIEPVRIVVPQVGLDCCCLVVRVAGAGGDLQ